MGLPVLKHMSSSQWHVHSVQYVAVCCNVLQCVAACRSALQCVRSVCRSATLIARVVINDVYAVCSVLQCAAGCCSVLQ